MAHPWTPFGDRTPEFQFNLRKLVKAQIANLKEHKLLIFRSVSTRERWANPLSIYGPTPTELAVAAFNAELRDRAAQMRMERKELQAHLAHLRTQRRGFRDYRPDVQSRRDRPHGTGRASSPPRH